MSNTLATVDRRNPVNRAESSNAGLLAWYPHLPNWTGGATCRDIKNGQHASLRPNTAWNTKLVPPGGIGSLYCDGSANCGLLITDSSAFVLPIFTLSLWFYPLNTSNYQCLMVRGNGGGAGRDWSLFMVAGSTNQMYYSMNGSNIGPVGISPGITLGSWNYAALTCSLVAGSAVINILINGLPAYNNPSASPSSISSGYVSIGNEIGAALTSLFPFTGYIASPTIWNRALSNKEVGRRYLLEKQGFAKVFNRQRSPVYGVSSASFRPGSVTASPVIGSGVY